MSLKAFHIVFVTLCLMLALGLAGWSTVHYVQERSAFYLVFGVGWLIAAIGLLVYGRHFLRKLRRISYL
jgi:hypothetical protein